MVGLRSFEESGHKGVCGLASEGPQWCERPCGHMQNGIRKSQMKTTQKLIPHKEEGGEIASGLLVVPAPASGAAGEAGRGQPWWRAML